MKAKDSLSKTQYKARIDIKNGRAGFYTQERLLSLSHKGKTKIWIIFKINSKCKTSKFQISKPSKQEISNLKRPSQKQYNEKKKKLKAKPTKLGTNEAQQASLQMEVACKRTLATNLHNLSQY